MQDSTVPADGGQASGYDPVDSLVDMRSPTTGSSRCVETPSELGRSLWHEALESLEKLEPADYRTIKKNILESRIKDPGEEIFERIESLVEDKKQHFQGSKQEVPDPAGKPGVRVAIRSLLPKVLVCIRRFKEIGDIAVSFDPIHAALPWAAAVTVTEEQAGLLLAGLERVSYLAVRSGGHQRMYLTQSSGVDTESKKHLSTALVNLYVEILSFLALAIRRFSKGKVRQIASALFSPDVVISAFSSLHDCELRLAKEAGRCHASFTQNAHKDLKANVDHIHAVIDDHSIKLDAHFEEMRLWMKTEDQTAALQWLSETRYQSNHNSARSGHVEGTGVWLLEHHEFRRWVDCHENASFWLHGIPGAGKTMLIANLVQTLLPTLKSERNHVIAYFYCDRNSPTHSDPLSILRSIIRQLAAGSLGKQGLNRHVYDLYMEQKVIGIAADGPSLENCQALLPQLVASNSRTIIVLDGLDECHQPTRYQLMDILNELVKHPGHDCSLKIFVSSRDDRDLKVNYIGGFHLKVGSHENRSDIRRYVESRLEKEAKHIFHEPLTSELEDLKDDILATFQEKSEGMFQWAVLQMNGFLKLLDFWRREDFKEKLRSHLSKLPKGLEKSYQQIMSCIAEEPDLRVDVARRAFWCVVNAKRHISPKELVAAVFQAPEEGDIFSKPNITIDVVLECCQNLIVQDEEECRLSHLSVAEFLESYDAMKPRIPEVHLLGKLCLQLLLVDPETRERHALEDYKNYWHAHFTQHNFETADVKTTELLLKFLGPPEAVSDSLGRWHRSRGRILLADAPTAFTALEWGLWTTLVYWLDESKLHPDWSYNNQSLLYRVVREEDIRKDVLECLLQHRADINAPMGPNGPTALLAAVRKGDANRVRRLLNTRTLKAEVNHGVHPEKGSPLCLAISLIPLREFSEGSTHNSLGKDKKAHEVLKALLEGGADPNFTDGYGDFLPALHLNVQRCQGNYAPWKLEKHGRNYDPDVTDLLIHCKHNADINLQTAEHGTALELAVTLRNAIAVEHLLSLGADYNLGRPLYTHLDNALLIESREVWLLRPSVNVVQHLVNAGALDYLLGLPDGEKTQQDLVFEERLMVLEECMPRSGVLNGDYDYQAFFGRVQGVKQRRVLIS